MMLHTIASSEPDSMRYYIVGKLSHAESMRAHAWERYPEHPNLYPVFREVRGMLLRLADVPEFVQRMDDLVEQLASEEPKL